MNHPTTVEPFDQMLIDDLLLFAKGNLSMLKSELIELIVRINNFY